MQSSSSSPSSIDADHTVSFPSDRELQSSSTVNGESKSKVKKHTKSHFGCNACKQRKVKCDESKPVCRNCVRLRLECVYLSSLHWSKKKKNKKVKTGDQSIEMKIIEAIGDTFNEQDVRISPDVHFEVVLMHQWDISTSLSLSCLGFEKLFPIDCPKLAFNFRFLLDTMFLLSVSHLNHYQSNKKYEQAIVFYHSRAVSGLRNELDSGITEANGEAIALASSLLAIYSFTCDTDQEFGGVAKGWLPLFLGVRDIFQVINWRNSPGSIFLGLHEAKSQLPSGDEYLTKYELIFSKQKDKQDVYRAAIKNLAALKELIILNPKGHFILHQAAWIARLHPVIIQLINKFDSCALVILFNYFKTLTRLEDCWYLDPYAKIHCERIKSKIPSEWYIYLD